LNSEDKNKNVISHLFVGFIDYFLLKTNNSDYLERALNVMEAARDCHILLVRSETRQLDISLQVFAHASPMRVDDEELKFKLL